MTVDKKNIFLDNTQTSVPYSSKPAPIECHYPKRDKIQHAEFIECKLKTCYENSFTQKQAAAIRYKEGVYLEFSSDANYDLACNSLENIQQGIRLLNVKLDDDSKKIKATVYIPSGKETYFLKKVEAYSSEVTKNGNPKNNDLISSIGDIKIAVLESFWIGKASDIPDTVDQWCEVWLRYEEDNADKVKSAFLKYCNVLEIERRENNLLFPERLVVLIKANRVHLTKLISCCEFISEFRRAPEPTSFFDELSGREQAEWSDEFLSRINFNNGRACICILDTGLNQNHPLLNSAVDANTVQAVRNSWGVNDHFGHGTEMAGICLYKDLKEQLLSTNSKEISHKIESVKILPPSGANKFELYGAITEQAVALAEIENPDANRVICMAVTASEFNTDDGSPTSWSAAIDSITSGANENGEKRLFFVSAGNVYPNEFSSEQYPDANMLHGVENPGQSWNCITVGATSNDIQIRDSLYKGFRPIADCGQLSPYSSTSTIWNKKWPIKPEILLDGGNMATNGNDYTECEDLSLLSTNYKPLDRYFSTIWGTSSATAQAAWMAAQIYSEYPDIWPETVRALLIHSASWTDKMRMQFCSDDKKTTGRNMLLHTCGYGVPNLSKAIQCASNSVNLIIQGTLTPFKKNSMNEMHFHKLPWPEDVLKALGAVNAKLKVTLSYFVEPGPGEVGWKDKYRYPSYGLRFDVINSNEELEDFQKRVNRKMRGEDIKDNGDGNSRDWYLGTNNRDVGSIHSDFCDDVAVNLCSAKYVAVYPVIGWWRERPHLGRYNEEARYSLIVSIETPAVSSDLYTSIITQIATQVSDKKAISIPTFK